LPLYLNVRLFEPAWPPTITVTDTVVFFCPAGVTAVHSVLLEQDTLVAAAEPKKNCVEPATKPAPLIVTWVPPLGEPEPGEIDVSDGAVTAMYE
jgi:hypothetical protein